MSKPLAHRKYRQQVMHVFLPLLLVALKENQKGHRGASLGDAPIKKEGQATNMRPLSSSPKPHMAMGHNPVPPVNIPIPTTGSKMGGEFTYQPKWNPIGFDPQHEPFAFLVALDPPAKSSTSGGVGGKHTFISTKKSKSKDPTQ